MMTALVSIALRTGVNIVLAIRFKCTPDYAMKLARYSSKYIRVPVALSAVQVFRYAETVNFEMEAHASKALVNRWHRNVMSTE